MDEKKYLKWYNKVGYGSGDVAGNVVYAFLSSFVMIYLTDTVGLNPGIVGTLIAVSKLFDGITDIFFGSMIGTAPPDAARSWQSRCRSVHSQGRERCCHRDAAHSCAPFQSTLPACSARR